jgi:Protein of unknown function (DUF3800)
MLKLEAHFDETGHGGDANTKFLGIAGCLSEAGVWPKVESKWRAALQSEGLPYFHMREYSFSVGPFRGWDKDEARRKKIYGALWNIILEANLIPLGGFVRLENYQEELTGQEHHVFRDAYFLCYLQCLRFLAQYIDSDAVIEVATFFDNKPGFKGEALKIHNVLDERFKGKIPPPIFRDMRLVLPLQIADIIAYESKKEFERRLFEPEQKPRWGFERLEELMSRPAPVESVPFGSEGCPIALLSREELANISAVQKLAHDE